MYSPGWEWPGDLPIILTFNTLTKCSQRWVDLIWHAEPLWSNERAGSMVQGIVLHAPS